MRWLQIGAALNGALASLVLVAALHPLRDHLTPERLNFMTTVAALELGAAAALLALAARIGGRANAIGGALILIGVSVLSVFAYLLGRWNMHIFDPAVPIGGLIAILGWLVLTFAQPRRDI